MSKIFTLTKIDLDENNFYVGATDVSDFSGSIVIESNLGWVKFKGSINVSMKLTALAGSGIKAGWGIKAGLSIAAKWLQTPLRIFAGLCIWKIPAPDEMTIKAELRKGTIAFGLHVPPEANASE